MKRLLGEELYEKFIKYSSVTEIRIRLYGEVVIKCFNVRYLTGIRATQSLIKNIIGAATGYSPYAYDEEFRRGFIFYGNGVRIGVAGSGSVISDCFKGFKNITSLCIRIPHQILDCAKPFSYLFDNFGNTLVVSPPGGGKTTLIRDLTRNLSCNYDVLAIDERYELAGADYSLDLGPNTDVLQGIPKKICYENALRSMSPQIIVCDEIFGEDDNAAIERLTFSGIKVLASVHAETFPELEKIYPSLADKFSNIITLSSIPKAGSIKSILRR